MSQNYSAFDPNLFLDATTTEVNERRQVLPVENPDREDGLYVATIGDVKTDSGTIQKGDKTGQPWVSVLVPLKVEVPPSLRESLNLPPQLTFTDRVFLDLTEDGKGIDNAPGKNRGQKHYRDVFDLNKPGEPFAWRMIQARPLLLKIQHEMVQPTDGTEQFPREVIAATMRFAP